MLFSVDCKPFQDYFLCVFSKSKHTLGSLKIGKKVGITEVERLQINIQ